MTQRARTTRRHAWIAAGGVALLALYFVVRVFSRSSPDAAATKESVTHRAAAPAQTVMLAPPESTRVPADVQQADAEWLLRGQRAESLLRRFDAQPTWSMAYALVRDGLLLQMDIEGTVQPPAPASQPPSTCNAEFVLATRSSKHKAACFYPVARTEQPLYAYLHDTSRGFASLEQWNTEFPAEHRAEIRQYAQARLLQLREMLELPPSGSFFP